MLVDIGLDANGPPISTAAFVVSGARVAIDIDAAAFHHGDRLRRDRLVQQGCAAAARGWDAVEPQAADLGRGDAVVEEIRRASAT